MKNIAKNYIDEIKNVENINGREVVMEYTSLEEEYKALRNDNGIIDRSGFSVIKVIGDETAEFLDRLCTKDIMYLNIDMISECLMLDDDANALGAVWVMHEGDDYYVAVPCESSEEIEKWMKKQAQDADVTLEDCSDKALVSIEGRKTWQIVRDVFDLDVDILPLRGIQEIEDYEGAQFTVCRIGRTGEYGYMFFGDEASVRKAIDGCMDYASKKDIRLSFCGAAAEEVCMLETRQPNFRYENKSNGNVFELCEQWFIQFEKEEYIGHDALMKKFSEGRAKLSVNFILDDNTELTEGDDILLEDDKVGEVLVAKYSPSLGKTIGIGLMNAGCAVAGIELSVKGHALETVSSPVVRPLSWDEKME